MYHRGYGGGYGYHHGTSFMSGFLLLMSLCLLASCLFYGRGGYDPEPVMYQVPAQGYAVGPDGRPIMGPNGQPMMQGGVTVINQGGGYGYGGGGLAAGAATGFVGGMLVGEALDMGDHGYGGYGGGYGGEYGGGMGGGDGGFGADQ